MDMILMIVIGAATAALVTPLMQLLKKVSSVVDGLPAALKQLAVGLLAFGVAKLYALLGLPMPDSGFLGMDATAAQTFVGAVLSFLAHHFIVKKGAA